MDMSAEHMSKFCIPSPVMMTSQYEWKIVEWDDKPTKKTPQKPYYEEYL